MNAPLDLRPLSRRSEACPDRLSREVARLHEELEREQRGACELRAALELAATYFQPTANSAQDDEAWMQIVQAIRSEAGRSQDRGRADCAGLVA